MAARRADERRERARAHGPMRRVSVAGAARDERRVDREVRRGASRDSRVNASRGGGGISEAHCRVPGAPVIFRPA